MERDGIQRLQKGPEPIARAWLQEVSARWKQADGPEAKNLSEPGSTLLYYPQAKLMNRASRTLSI